MKSRYLNKEYTKKFRAYCKRWAHTPTGYLSRQYTQMMGRVKGQKKDHLQYKGLPILPRKEFYKWALQRTSPFFNMWRAYEASGFQLTLAPSIDRIDGTKGYLESNIQFLTLGENVKKSFQGERYGRNSKQKRIVGLLRTPTIVA